jgi:hypothetical protein
MKYIENTREYGKICENTGRGVRQCAGARAKKGEAKGEEKGEAKGEAKGPKGPQNQFALGRSEGRKKGVGYERATLARASDV